MDQRQHAQCFLPADVGLETGKAKNFFIQCGLGVGAACADLRYGPGSIEPARMLVG